MLKNLNELITYPFVKDILFGKFTKQSLELLVENLNEFLKDKEFREKFGFEKGKYSLEEAMSLIRLLRFKYMKKSNVIFFGNISVENKPLTKQFILENTQIENGNYNSALYSILISSKISKKRLKDLGIGDAGLSFDPHFLLDSSGKRTNWIVKRLKSKQFKNPDKQFRLYWQEHKLFELYFGRFIPETTHVILDSNFDNGSQYISGREYMMFQQFIDGIFLDEIGKKYDKKIPTWLKAELMEYIYCYRKMQINEGVIPDCYSLDDDQLIVDERRKRIYLVDTNNPKTIRSLIDNTIFRKYFKGPIDEVTPNRVHDIWKQICEDYNFDPLDYSANVYHNFDIQSVRAVEDVSRHFPRDHRDTKYVLSIINTFGLSEIANP